MASFTVAVFDRKYRPVVDATVAELDTDNLTILNSAVTNTSGIATISTSTANWLPVVLVGGQFKTDVDIVVLTSDQTTAATAYSERNVASSDVADISQTPTLSDVAGCTVTLPDADQTYVVIGKAHIDCTSAPNSGEVIAVGIYDASDVLQGQSGQWKQNTWQADDEEMIEVVALIETTSADEVYKLSALRGTATGTVKIEADQTEIIAFKVGNQEGGHGTSSSISDHADVAAMTEASGDVLYHNGTAWTRLAKGSDGQVLKLASGLPAWGTDDTGGGGPHTLDDNTVHTDVAAQANSQGDMLHFSSSVWNRLSLGTNGYFMRSNGTSPYWYDLLGSAFPTSWSDTSITGAELEELSDGSETTLHSHAAAGGAPGPLQNGEASTVLTLASGAVTRTGEIHLIAAETGTEDTLETMAGGSVDDYVLISADYGDTITVSTGSGTDKFFTTNNRNAVIEQLEWMLFKRLSLTFNQWYEIARSVQSASDTMQGIVELATTAEVNLGSSNGRAVTPESLQDGKFNERSLQVTIETPAVGDSIKIHEWDRPITISEVRGVCFGGSSPDVDINLYHHANRNTAIGSANKVLTTDLTITSETTSTSSTTFTDATVPADAHLWLYVSQATSVPTAVEITIYYTYD